MKRLVPVVCILVIAVCCGGGGTSSAPAVPTAPSPAPAPAPAPSPAPPATGQNPAPQTLQGTWAAMTNTLDAANVRVTLRLFETTYTIASPGHSTTGSITVDGQVIEFFGTVLCDDSRGSYHWSVQGNALSFTETAFDACSARRIALNGITYTRQ